MNFRQFSEGEKKLTPIQDQRQKNLEGWQKNDPRFKVCCDGIAVTKARRDYSQCSQCLGSGWKMVK